jgi:hypothetical protein
MDENKDFQNPIISPVKKTPLLKKLEAQNVKLDYLDEETQTLDEES